MEKLLGLGALALCSFGALCKADTIKGHLSVVSVDMVDGEHELHYYLNPHEECLTENCVSESTRLIGDKTKSLPLLSEIALSVETGGRAFTESGEPIAIVRSFDTHGLDVEAEKLKRLSNSTPATHVHSAAMIIVDTPTKKASDHSNYDTLTKLYGDLDAFYREASYNQVGLAADSNGDGKSDIYGPFNVTSAGASCSNYNKLSQDARAQAVAAGMDDSSFEHRIYVLPATLGCGWLGLAEVGCDKKCQMWMPYQPNTLVYGHEFGHNLGMYHASTGPDGRVKVEYGDWSDIMGNEMVLKQFNPPHLDQMGWYTNISSTWLQTVPKGTTGTFPLRGLALLDGGSEPRALKIPRKAGGNYYIAYRYAEGLDVNLNSSYKNQLVIYSWDGTDNTVQFKTVALGTVVMFSNVMVAFKSADENLAQVTVTVK